MEVDAWLDGAADDVVFVPIAIDYEKLIEASSYVKELAGGEKEKESLRGLLGVAKVLWRRYERLYVQFEEPISLRALAEERLGEAAGRLGLDEAWGGETERAAALAPGSRGAPAEAKRKLVQALSNRIAYGISRAVTVTPVGLVAAALLSHVRRGLGAADVARRVELLRYIAAESEARFARDLAGAPSDPREAGPIADAVRRLQADGLLRVELAAGETIYLVVDERRPVLDYHRNAVIHRFVAPALFSAAARGGGTVDEVRSRTLWLSRLFKLEFMYRVGVRFDEVFDQNLAFFLRVGALSRDGDRLAPGAEPWTVPFLAEFVRAYLEAYRLTAETALTLLTGATGTHDRRALVKEALERGRAAFLSGGIVLRESLSKAHVENALEWLVSQGVAVESAGKLSVRDGGAGLREIVDVITPLLAS
jgi:glycerol-3-phosphate O-acyltransferase